MYRHDNLLALNLPAYEFVFDSNENVFTDNKYKNLAWQHKWNASFFYHTSSTLHVRHELRVVLCNYRFNYNYYYFINHNYNKILKVSATPKIAIFPYLRFQRFQIGMLESFLLKKKSEENIISVERYRG